MVVPVPPPAPPSGGGDPTSVFGPRVGAAVVDGVAVAVPYFAYTWSQVEYRDIGDTGLSGTEYCDRYTDEIGGFCVNVDDTVYYTDDAGGSSALILVGLAIALYVVLQGLTGWTIGKRLVGIRCVRADGSPPGVGRALVRWLLWIVDGLPCFGLVGVITALTTVGHRRVGDMAASTYVVRADAAGRPIVPDDLAGAVAPGPPGGPAGTPPTWPAPPTDQAPQHPAPTAREGPQWDEARGTYIQWDPARSAWMQWDDDAKAWIPIR